jgi:hypothetical protein
MISVTPDLLFFVHDFQSLGIIAVSITTSICQTPVDYLQDQDVCYPEIRPMTAPGRKWPLEKVGTGDTATDVGLVTIFLPLCHAEWRAVGPEGSGFVV